MAQAGAAFSCAKCHHNQSRFFNMQNKKFIAVSCTQCGYTEIFKGNSSMLGNFLDILSS